MWRSCRIQPSHKERAICAVRCKKKGKLLQPLRWCCVGCVIHHERNVREEQKYLFVARASNSKRDCEHDLYCCLLPRCEALRTCRSEFPIATVALLKVFADVVNFCDKENSCILAAVPSFIIITLRENGCKEVVELKKAFQQNMNRYFYGKDIRQQ